MSTVWEGKNGCDKQYMGDLAIYLMTVLLYSYGIIMDRIINAPVHVKNFVDVLNSRDKSYLKGEKKLMGKLGINDAKNIGMLPSTSKYVSINFADQ